MRADEWCADKMSGSIQSINQKLPRQERIRSACSQCDAYFDRPAGSAYPLLCTRHALMAQGLPDHDKSIKVLKWKKARS
jgi:hypothetical protein